ncbi:DUF87 domain-containing protein [Lysinibacillus endophyticus]|uniref:ATP-binding protein n=1 Tax=Ureibacillus endophyticus TaxID=1978490 RepID=UPI0031351D19
MEDKLTTYLNKSFGSVYNVDTRKVSVKIHSEEDLNTLKINDIVVFNGNNDDEKLIGIITRVSKKLVDVEDSSDDMEVMNPQISDNIAVVSLVGTFYQKYLKEKNVFRRAINTYPEINSEVFCANHKALSIIMNSLTLKSGVDNNLKIGTFASNKEVPAILDGNRFFQRHAAIVGSTGSGKSFTVANILEKVKNLPYSNAIVFDLHGEYNKLSYAKHLKIGSGTDGIHIPLWFFNYEEIHSLFIESSESTSANQRATVIEFILKKKKEYIEHHMEGYSSEVVTADTPIPFSIKDLSEYLNHKNTEEIETGEIYSSGAKKGEAKTKQGTNYGKLTNLINRLQTKIDDKKYSFVFTDNEFQRVEYLNEFINVLLDNKEKRVKVIDLSEVPSDILPIIIGIVTRLINDVLFWMSPNDEETRHPITLICDEAHIYMSKDTSKMKSVEKKSLEIFESIAKEGRKYGIGLVIISQRPSELNNTLVSQCNNIVSLKITNDRDKAAVANMLTDSLVGLVDLLPNLDVGECIVVGDAIMLPSKILLDKPDEIPRSSTIDFWDKWINNEKTVFDIDDAIKNMINQFR